jgi:hypothetical protein
MQALKDLTLDSHTVVVSIHQPRSSVFALFDDLILLSGARAWLQALDTAEHRPGLAAFLSVQACLCKQSW